MPSKREMMKMKNADLTSKREQKANTTNFVDEALKDLESQEITKNDNAVPSIKKKDAGIAVKETRSMEEKTSTGEDLSKNASKDQTISAPTEGKSKKTQVVSTIEEPTQTAGKLPQKNSQPKFVLEKKGDKKGSRTRSFYMLDSVYERLQQLSEEYGRSVSDTLNDILSQVL